MSQQDQFVFGYWNGSADVFADPLTVDRNLRGKSGGQVWTWLRDLRAVGPKDAENDPLEVKQSNMAHRIGIAEKARVAAEFLIALVREVFEMTPFDKTTGVGATENDCHRVLTAWFAFVAKKNENTEPSPT